jgi:hypothetical protein
VFDLSVSIRFSKVDRDFIVYVFILPSSIIQPSHQAANYQVLLKQALNKKATAAEKVKHLASIRENRNLNFSYPLKP